MLCVLLYRFRELGADDLALGLGLGDIDKLVEEAVGGVDVDEVGVHLVLEDVDDLPALALAHESMIHVHTDELLADGLDKKCRDDGAVDATGEGQQDLLVTHLFADCVDLLGDESLGKLGSGDACHVVRALVGIHA